ncbi:hypothetical protein J0S82_020768 [Galemys pyrenaicus]|uniref:Uncharacterized protein n=1 Tax=Galemys pyrenaicus TaxID=202257 RepID=A0A8J5ZSC3_GALPY|nr:hypothetical protein J0S82_020768 [Galemys pyrenaicus]
MEGQDEVSAREQHFHSQVRESTVSAAAGRDLPAPCPHPARTLPAICPRPCPRPVRTLPFTCPRSARDSVRDLPVTMTLSTPCLQARLAGYLSETLCNRDHSCLLPAHALPSTPVLSLCSPLASALCSQCLCPNPRCLSRVPFPVSPAHLAWPPASPPLSSYPLSALSTPGCPSSICCSHHGPASSAPRPVGSFLALTSPAHPGMPSVTPFHLHPSSGSSRRTLAAAGPGVAPCGVRVRQCRCLRGHGLHSLVETRARLRTAPQTALSFARSFQAGV